MLVFISHVNLEFPSWSAGVSCGVCSVLVFITVMVIRVAVLLLIVSVVMFVVYVFISVCYVLLFITVIW